MPRYKVIVQQWVQQIAEKIVEADNMKDVRDELEYRNTDSSDWDWLEGSDSKDFEIIGIAKLEEEPGDPRE